MFKEAGSLGNKQKWLEWILLISIVAGYYIWFSSSTVYSASSNSRLLEVFDGDEYNNFNVVHEALMEHTLHIRWEVYGHFFYNLALIPFYILQRFIPISDQSLIVFQRVETTFFSAATVILTFTLARRYFNSRVAWLGSMFLMVFPASFNRWAVTSHPDSLQMFLLVGGFLGCSEYLISKNKRWLMFATVFAGLAFATKYAGIFLLPLIWALGVGAFDGTGKPIDFSFLKPQRFKSSFWFLFLLTFLFLAAFAISSPYSLVGWQFLKGIATQSSFTNQGDIFLVDQNFLEWFVILASFWHLGGNSVFLIFGFILFSLKIWKTSGGELSTVRGIMWIWVLFFFAYLLVRVNLRHERYLLIFLPFLCVLLGDFWDEVLSYARTRSSGKTVYYLAVGVLALVFSLNFQSGFARQLALIEKWQTREYNNPAIEAGKWIEAHYAPSARVLYDKYSYVPPKFSKVWGTYDMDYEVLNNFNPRVVVINPSIRDNFLDASIADSYVDGAERFMVIHNFYNAMENQELGYVFVAEFGGIKIYEKEH